ncbi:iron-sulfur cluster assembly scaffold protein IscU/NifU-like [Hydrogenimonas sp.]|nr:iron-sulfur cluster assembly scaffold protein IscU/NifU-like [Hydrogenimonas sp.]
MEELKETVEKQAAGEELSFNDMTLVQKIKAIDSVIDESVRQYLIMDGMEVLDVKQNGRYTDVYIRYLGACSGMQAPRPGHSTP